MAIILCVRASPRRSTMYYLAVVNDDDHHNHNHRIQEKRRRNTIERKGDQKTEKEGSCDNERKIEKETVIQRSKSQLKDVQASKERKSCTFE